MSWLEQSFKELCLQLKQGRGFSHTGTDPLYYLIFPPEKMLEVKRQLNSWVAKLKHDGWQVQVFSMIDAVHNILMQHELRQIWLESEKEDIFNFDDINKTLSDALMGTDALKHTIRK